MFSDLHLSLASHSLKTQKKQQLVHKHSSPHTQVLHHQGYRIKGQHSSLCENKECNPDGLLPKGVIKLLMN